MRHAILASLLICILGQAPALAAEDGPDALTVSAAPEAGPESKRGLAYFYALSNKHHQDIAAAYAALPSGAGPSEAPSSFYDDAPRAARIMSFLLRRQQRANLLFNVPVLFSYQADQSFVIDRRYQSGRCSGLGYFEAEVKGLCVSRNPHMGLVAAPAAIDFAFDSDKAGVWHMLPGRGSGVDYAALSFNWSARLLGFNSSFKWGSLHQPFSTFDLSLYYAKSGDRFDNDPQVLMRCRTDNPGHCPLIFSGFHTSQLMAESAGQADPKRRYGIDISFDVRGMPFLQLRHSLLSASSFVNYPFFIEAELAMLQDLGYPLERREFFGRSIYGSKLKLNLEQDFAQWDSTDHLYETRVPNPLPLTIGLHVYGDDNYLNQAGNILQSGAGTAGIRVDGSLNRLTLEEQAEIESSGPYSAGILISGGHDNQLDIEGRVSALGDHSVALAADIGSSVYYDSREYLGSWIRASGQACFSGRLTCAQAAALPLSQEVSGPLVSEINISGLVEGSTALMIGSSSFVSEINVLPGAIIRGDIISKWAPYLDAGSAYVPRQNDMHQLSAKVQYPLKLKGESLLEALTTKLYFGHPDGKLGSRIKVLVDGRIMGPRLDLIAVNSSSLLTGRIKVNNLTLNQAKLALHAGNFTPLEAKNLSLRNRSVLDLADGSGSLLQINGSSYISPSSSLRLDVTADGRILDRLILKEGLKQRSRAITIEPALSYADLRSLSSDPKSLQIFAENFIYWGNLAVSQYGAYIRFPKHIWVSSGQYGRELRCSQRGCRIGRFVSNSPLISEGRKTWNYLSSGIGIVLIILGTLWYYRRRH